MDRDEAIKVIREYYPSSGKDLNEALETLIPELKESEDERIRKELIGFLQDEIDSINLLVSGDYDNRDADDIAHQNWCKKALAWLEKQGEQEQWDFVKPVSEEDKLYLMQDEKNLANSAKTCKVEQNPAWSEEDERMIGHIRGIIERYAFMQSAVDVNGDLCEREFIEPDEWLRTLKERYTWKPSDEQMKALGQAVKYQVFANPKRKEAFEALFNDLKKLKE